MEFLERTALAPVGRDPCGGENRLRARNIRTQHGQNPATARLLGNAFVQALRDSFADNATQWAAAIAYYSFLSLFPLILAAVSLSAYFVSPGLGDRQGDAAAA